MKVLGQQIVLQTVGPDPPYVVESVDSQVVKKKEFI